MPDQGLPYYDGGPRGCLQLTLSTLQTDRLPAPVEVDEQNEPTVRSARPISPTEPVSDQSDQRRSPTTDANRFMGETVVPPPTREMTLPAQASYSSEAKRLDTVVGHRNKPLRQHMAALLVTVALLLIISGVLTTMLTHNTTVTNSTNATATAKVHQAIATVRAENPDLYPPAGTLALLDLLSGPNQWQEQSDKDFGGACQFVHDAYQISQSPLNKLYPCYENNSYSNFAFEVKMTINQGNCGGMTIRYDSYTGEYYFFIVCQNGYYRFYKNDPHSAASNTKPLAYSSSLAIHQGNQSNLIAVVANGSEFDLYVNSQKIVSASDSSYSGGNIGLLAYADDNVTTVTYQDARVWKIDKNKA